MATAIEAAQAAVDAAQQALDSANASGKISERIAASKELAAARKELAAANNEQRLAERAAREDALAKIAAQAEADRPKTGQEMAAQLKGVRPVLESESGGPFGGWVDYKPMDEGARRAIFGYNPATGQAYTDAESAAANAGYNPYAGAVGYEIDPRTGNINVLTSQGTVLTSGATYQYTPKGYIVPSDAYMQNFPGFGYDEYGRMINAQGQLITQADIDTYNSLIQKDPEAAREFARGKGMSTTGGGSLLSATGATGGFATGTQTPTSTGTPSAIGTGYKSVGGSLTYNGVPYTGTYAGQNYLNGVPLGVDTTGTGSSAQAGGTGPNLAINAFKNTLSLFFGPTEAAKPWVAELYKVVSNFYKSGSSVEDSLNLALQDARNNPNLFEFNKRFKGIYALQDLRQAGKPVTVPTIAEYVKAQSAMADIFNQVGLGDIATEDFTGDLIGKGNSVSTVANKISNVFQRIDMAPKEIKDTLSRYYPTVDKTVLARTVLLGQKGVDELVDELGKYEILAAAENQGLGALGANALPGGVTEERAQEYARLGETYASILPKFGRVANALPVVSKLSGISKVPDIGQTGLESALILGSETNRATLQKLSEQEEARFMGKTGRAETGLASQRRANRAF